jgi:hypothetical protein
VSLVSVGAVPPSMVGVTSTLPTIASRLARARGRSPAEVAGEIASWARFGCGADMTAEPQQWLAP